MKGTKLLLSLWLSTAAFCLLQILFGPGGLGEMAQLKDQQARLDARLEALKDDNFRLTAQYGALLSSPEAIRLEARSLGWFRTGDVPVRTLDGAEFRLPSDTPDLSLVPSLVRDEWDLSLFFRLAWPLLFVSCFVLLYLVEKLRPTRSPWDELNPSQRNLPVPFQTGLDFFRK